MVQKKKLNHFCCAFLCLFMKLSILHLFMEHLYFFFYELPICVILFDFGQVIFSALICKQTFFLFLAYECFFKLRIDMKILASFKIIIFFLFF